MYKCLEPKVDSLVSSKNYLTQVVGGGSRRVSHCRARSSDRRSQVPDRDSDVSRGRARSVTWGARGKGVDILHLCRHPNGPPNSLLRVPFTRYLQSRVILETGVRLYFIQILRHPNRKDGLKTFTADNGMSAWNTLTNSGNLRVSLGLWSTSFCVVDTPWTTQTHRH